MLTKIQKRVGYTILNLVQDEKGQQHLLEIVGGLAIVAFILSAVFPNITTAVVSAFNRLITTITTLF